MFSKIQKIFQSVKERLLPQSYSLNQTKVINAISLCRTPQMGGFVQRCDDCGHTEAYYHSCRNRHCPICQGSNQQKWVEKQVANTLPLPYFHVVFTLPSELNPLIRANPVELFNLLFRAASKTLLTLAKDKNFLGAQPGFTAILHTWGSNLQFHPHLHCIVAGGGLSIDHKRFVVCKDSFFLPIKAISAVFRGKFLDELKTFFVKSTLHLPENLNTIAKRQQFLDNLYATKWVCYCKKPFRDASDVIRYLGRYTHRVAISEGRIVSYNPDTRMVRFKWKDYKSHNAIKIMELSDDEFVRRFLLHVLPTGFMKIRHYGFLGNNGRDKRLETCRKLLNAIVPKGIIPSFPKRTQEPLLCCPCCGSCSFGPVFSSARYQPVLLPTGTGP
ncbi:MAG TPA: IS91 family transposase [Firmicutes bacterium]|jgi:hypothetical protein|nr:IS91 family transposase [Bacillota bacterium]